MTSLRTLGEYLAPTSLLACSRLTLIFPGRAKSHLLDNSSPLNDASVLAGLHVPRLPYLLRYHTMRPLLRWNDRESWQKLLQCREFPYSLPFPPAPYNPFAYKGRGTYRS